MVVEINIINNQENHRCVVSKLDDGVGVVRGQTVVGKWGVQAGAKPTPLRDPRGEGARG